jgi:hypothetical protein
MSVGGRIPGLKKGGREMPDAAKATDRAVLLDLHARVHEAPEFRAAVTAHLEIGDLFELGEAIKGERGLWARVRLPSGATGFIPGATRILRLPADVPVDQARRATLRPVLDGLSRGLSLNMLIVGGLLLLFAVFLHAALPNMAPDGAPAPPGVRPADRLLTRSEGETLMTVVGVCGALSLVVALFTRLRSLWAIRIGLVVVCLMAAGLGGCLVVALLAKTLDAAAALGAVGGYAVVVTAWGIPVVRAHRTAGRLARVLRDA